MKKNIGNRGQPLFLVTLWNQHNSVLTGTDRTNNVAEAAHRALYSVIGGNHPNLWTFVDLLKTTQNSRDLSVEHAISGIPPPQKNIRLRQADQRLHTLVSEFGQNTNLIEFLRGISYNFSMD